MVGDVRDFAKRLNSVLRRYGLPDRDAGGWFTVEGLSSGPILQQEAHYYWRQYMHCLPELVFCAVCVRDPRKPACFQAAMPLYTERSPDEWVKVSHEDDQGRFLPQSPTTWQTYYDANQLGLDYLGNIELVRATQAHLKPEQIHLRRLGREVTYKHLQTCFGLYHSTNLVAAHSIAQKGLLPSGRRSMFLHSSPRIGLGTSVHHVTRCPAPSSSNLTRRSMHPACSPPSTWQSSPPSLSLERWWRSFC